MPPPENTPPTSKKAVGYIPAVSSQRSEERSSRTTPGTTLFCWDDRLQHLREICNSLKYRSVVYDQWGFDLKLSLDKGLKILFAGPSGKGKTIAAEIMAGERGFRSL